MTNKIKNKGAQTEPSQCNWLTSFLPRINYQRTNNYLNLLVMDKAGMAESGQMRLVDAQFSSQGNEGSKLSLGESPSPSVQNLE